jgi:hypothetical protein
MSTRWWPLPRSCWCCWSADRVPRRVPNGRTRHTCHLRRGTLVELSQFRRIATFRGSELTLALGHHRRRAATRRALRRARRDQTVHSGPGRPVPPSPSIVGFAMEGLLWLGIDGVVLFIGTAAIGAVRHKALDRVWVTPPLARRRTSPRRVPRDQPATSAVVTAFSLPHKEIPPSTSGRANRLYEIDNDSRGSVSSCRKRLRPSR